MMKRLFVCALVALGGCAPAGEESSSPETSDSTTSSATTSEVTKTTMHASFVREEKAGEAPALLRLFNETPDQILSVTLDDGRPYTFYTVEPAGISDYVITASDDMWTDAILSIHTLDTCIRKPFSEMTGPLSLEPGHAYAIHVSVESGFFAHIEEEAAPEPFIGFRALVSDPVSSATPAPSKLVLSMGGDPPAEIVYETIFTEYSEPYVLVPASKVELQKILFVDRSGKAHETTSPLIFEGAHGYTVHVTNEEQPGAEVDVLLEAVAE